MLKEHRYDDAEQLHSALAEMFRLRIANAVRLRGRAAIVVSGGRSPCPLYRKLAPSDLPWDRVTLVCSDERWVEPDAESSNEGMIRRVLLAGPAAAARLVRLKTDHKTPEEGESACNAAVAALPKPFDLVLLGMGSDGHIASLIPGTAGLAAALDPSCREPCKAITGPGLAHPRMTLTVSALLDSHEIIVLFTGEEKLRVFVEARVPGRVEDLPVRAVLHQDRVNVQVFWAPSE